MGGIAIDDARGRMTGPARRVIVHMDCDAFYYSVECLRDPTLVGKPVIVAGSGPRAVVTTASYEARKFGIGSAMPAARALRLCPTAIVVPPQGELYRAKSREVWSVVGERLGLALAQVSLDEAYADVSAVAKPVSLMREIVDLVAQRAGIGLSVGIGPSRAVAKAASDAQKPRGFVVLSREQACALFAPRSPRVLQGVGPKTADRLLALGLSTVGAIQVASEDQLIERFGARMGRFLKASAFFLDDSPVVTARVAKSRSSETTYDEDLSDMAELEQTVRRLAADVCTGLARRGTGGRTIAIKVRLDDWTNVTRARTIDHFTHDAATVTEVAIALLREYAPPRPVRLLGVRVASFEGVEGTVAPRRPEQAPAGPRASQQLVLPV